MDLVYVGAFLEFELKRDKGLFLNLNDSKYPKFKFTPMTV